jgi:hypothetical protein
MLAPEPPPAAAVGIEAAPTEHTRTQPQLAGPADDLFDEVRVAAWAKRRPSWERIDPAHQFPGVPISELYGCALRNPGPQSGEKLRRCYCGNSSYHKVAGAPLWICSTCHPPTLGRRVVERFEIENEGESS